MKTLHHSLVVAIVVSALTACSDSDDPANDNSSTNMSRMVNKVGSVQINDVVEDDVEFLAFFYGADRPVSATDITNHNIPEAPSEDQCEFVINAPESDGNNIPGSDDNVLWTFQSAGDAITVSSSAGSYVELQQNISTILPDVYFSPVSLLSPAPTGLTVDIPGDQFPAFSSVTIPDVEPFVLTSDPEDLSEFSADSVDNVITWEKGSNPDTPIILYTNLNINIGDLERRLTIDCVLVDDGSFNFDQASINRLYEAGFHTLPLNVGRQEETVVQQGDALLFLQRSSGNL